MYYRIFHYNCQNTKHLKQNHDIEHIKWLVEKLNPDITLLNIGGKGYCLDFQPENQRIYLKDLTVTNTIMSLKLIIVDNIVYAHKSNIEKIKREKIERDYREFLDSLNDKQRKYFIENYIEADYREWY